LKHFAPFRFDPVNQCLWHHTNPGADERILIKPKPFAILQYLLEHAGRLVTQDELLQAVWPDTFVQPEVLKRHILDIRNVLGDDARNPVFIETQPRRGYRFIARIEDESSAGAIASVPTRSSFVGRERALSELRGYFKKTLVGQRQIVFITGEPGIGKTTLVDEFERHVATESFVRVARGQCVEGYGGKEPYYPMLEALGNLLRRPGAGDLVQALLTSAPTWLVQFPALVKREQREMLQREILGATRERMLREMGEALQTFTSTAPLVVIFEDLHWVDPATVDLISALARTRTAGKLMLIGTYRAVDIAFAEHPLKAVNQNLAVHQLCHEIALDPLGEYDISSYLAAESPDGRVPEGLANLLYRHSEGNPLFMITALAHMGRRGLISDTGGAWQLSVPLDEIDLDVPEDLRQMIEAQMERLSSEEQRALEAGSVEGVFFSPGVCASAANLGEEEFEDLCEMLSRQKLMLRWVETRDFPEETVSPRYGFIHALYREVFYRRLTGGRRAKLHLRVGQRLEDLYHGREIEIAAELAHHFEQSYDWVRAVKYLQLAADADIRRYVPREAVAILQHALELAGRMPEDGRDLSEIEVLQQLGTIYVALWEPWAALETYQKLTALAARHGLMDIEIRALMDMALPAFWSSAQLCRETIERALQLSIRQADPLMRARTRARCFAWRAICGRWCADDAESCRQAMEEVESLSDPIPLAELRLHCAHILSLSSHYREAHCTGLESLRVLLRQGELNPSLGVHDFLGVHYHIYRIFDSRGLALLGEWRTALEEVEGEIDVLEKNGEARTGEVLVWAAWVYLSGLDFARVLAMYESISALVRLPTAMRCWHILVGCAESGLGNYSRGLENLLKTRQLMEREPLMNDWLNRPLLQGGLTEVWLAKGDLAQARLEAERFLEVSLATDERTFQGLAWETNARIAIAQGFYARAEECIANAFATINGYEVPLAAWRVHATAAQLFRSKGDTTSAEHHHELARTTILYLADSLPSEHPLRNAFLSAVPVRRVLEA
jgi:DNA-binding winged helix-turn-helix (wHTH) protein